MAFVPTYDSSRHMTAAQTVSVVAGVAFLAVGVAGFVPGVTQHLDQITFAGHDSDTMLLGAFHVSVLHNIVHLLFGVLGIAAAKRHVSAWTFLVAGGLVYLALWIYGLAIDKESDANFVPVNRADDWLHFGLGAAMLVAGVALMRRHHEHRPSASEMRSSNDVGTGPTTW